METPKKRGRPREWQDTAFGGVQAHPSGRIRHGKTELIPHKKGGHLFVRLRGEDMPVDELVAIAAGNKPDSSRWVRLVHIDGDPLNCAAQNLKWVRDEFAELDWLMRQPPVSRPKRTQLLG